MCARLPMRASAFSSSRFTPTISPAWRESPRRAACSIGADEGIHSKDDIERHHAAKAAQGVSLKAIKLGGVRQVLDASKLCDRLGMNLNISCKTGESSVASAAALHLAAVVPSLAWGLTVTSPGLAEDVVTDPLRIDHGHMMVLDRPGLGVEVDERRVRRAQQDFKKVA